MDDDNSKTYTDADTAVFDHLTVEQMKMELARCHDRLGITHCFEFITKEEQDLLPEGYSIDSMFRRIDLPFSRRVTFPDDIVSLELKIILMKEDLELYRKALWAMAEQLTTLSKVCVVCRGVGYLDDGGEYTVPGVCTLCPKPPTEEDIQAMRDKYLDMFDTENDSDDDECA